MFNLDDTFAAWHGLKGITSKSGSLLRNKSLIIKRGNRFMGTQKASSAGKTGKSANKHSTKEKGSKSVSKLSSIKQALFGGGAGKKPAPSAAPAKLKKDLHKPTLKGSVKSPSPSTHSSHGHGAHGHAKSTPTPSKQAHPAKSKDQGPALKKSMGHESQTKKTTSASSSKGSASVSSRGSYLETAEAVCREVACEGLATSAGYCRLHYIKNWKKIKRKELILKEGKLNQYIEELVAKYPDKYIEAIRQDLAHDKDFAKVIYDLDLDESLDDFDGEGEGSDHIIDSIKRDFDDEGDSSF